MIDLQDRTIIGNPNPDFVYGINLELSYKNLSLRVLANGVYGNDIANGNLLQLATPEGISWSNITTAAYNNAWRQRGHQIISNWLHNKWSDSDA